MEPLVAVASRSFSASDVLRANLLDAFPRCRFNDQGLRLDGEHLAEFLVGASGAIVGVEQVDGALLDAVPTLRVVAKYGVGLDTIDIDELRARDVAFAWTPGTNAQAVAELTVLHMMATLRRVPEGLARVRAENWAPVTGRLLRGKMVGLVGVGHVARALAPLLAAFDCRIVGYDVVEFDVPGIVAMPLDDLLAVSDVVSVHVPLTPATRHLIGERELSLMKTSAVLVNTSRGGTVDQEALQRCLANGRIAGAGLDVLDPEPPTAWEIADMEGVFVTPHLAGSSEESNLAMGMAAIQGLVDLRSRLEG